MNIYSNNKTVNKKFFSENNKVSFITNLNSEGPNGNTPKIDEEMSYPLLPLRNMLLFPQTMMPVTAGRVNSRKLLQKSLDKKSYFIVTEQINPDTEYPDANDIYKTGVLAKVVKIIQMTEDVLTAVIQGFSRVKIGNIQVDQMGQLTANCNIWPEEKCDKNNLIYKTTIEACKEALKNISESADIMHFDMGFPSDDYQSCQIFVNFVANSIPTTNKERINLLECSNPQKRAHSLLVILQRELQIAKLKDSIKRQTQTSLDEQQRQFFLRREMETIRGELGEKEEDDYSQFLRRANYKNWDTKTRTHFENEVKKLSHIAPQSPEYSNQYDYLTTLLELPWNNCTKDNLNLKKAEKILEKHHFGMEKIKERILEQLAILTLRRDLKAPILCLYGPPGVGKTSLCRSIAEAMSRKYVRISLGGLHDEAEIRGHRRTYIGAMPGRIIKGIKEAGASNPVFVLDEIDKVGQDSVHGDPSSALLEVLDPEQNSTFHDNYLDTDYNLSKVLFIATANNISTIPGPLLDRMELINVSGYLTEEKIEIAKRHLIPKEIEAHGLDKKDVSFKKNAIEKIIEDYTRESGVRELDKKIAQILRKVALTKAKNGKFSIQESNGKERNVILENDIKLFLGIEEYSRDKYQNNQYAGVVTGLAWTSVGGEILFIETSLSRGKGTPLTLTGNLGDVMKESAMLALQYIKAHANNWDIDTHIFDNWCMHIHVPEGAVPKDGPSAGITIATSIASALTQRKVRSNLAMTGEITLRGKVLPVGGIKEKILAAKRAGITDIVLCYENEKNIREIPEVYVKGLTFHYVHDIDEVIDFALLNEKVEDPIDFTFK